MTVVFAVSSTAVSPSPSIRLKLDVTTKPFRSVAETWIEYILSESEGDIPLITPVLSLIEAQDGMSAENLNLLPA